MAGEDRGAVERALTAARAEFGIREGFPAEVLAAADEAAARVPTAAGRADRRDLPLVTVDPPGSRDLDQALYVTEEPDGGMRLWYAIADVGFFVDRGGVIEAEAWKRGLTFYGPDCKEPLYPPVLSTGAASLLPDQDRPCILFEFALDAQANVTGASVAPALVRSRAQLTYGEVTDAVEGQSDAFRGREWAPGLAALRRFGEAREALETARGGVSVPLVSQRVVQLAAQHIGYDVEFEIPVRAEEWNEQVSLLIGHQAAVWMMAGGVGMLRVMGPPDPDAVEQFRHAARTLGFDWADGTSYPAFMHALDVHHPRLTPLLWQARRVMRGADYVAFDGAPPADPLHHALAMPYAHATAPLRRLGDRYVLDLLVRLAAGEKPGPDEVATLLRLPAAMNEADGKSSKLERRGVDVGEAWILRDRVGETFPATVLGSRGGAVEVQIEEPPVRATAHAAEGVRPAPGDAVRVRLEAVDVAAGRTEFSLAE